MRISTTIKNHIKILVSAVAFFCMAFGGASCDKLKENKEEENQKSQVKKLRNPYNSKDSLVMGITPAQLPDSIKIKLKEGMKSQLAAYARRYKDEYYTGYFLTDLNGDSLPELWVKSGTHRDNSRLDMFYPLANGTLKKSSTPAEPGQYYIGKGYMIQIVTAGAGLVNVNRVSLHLGEMDIENIREINFLEDANAALPKPEEPQIESISFTDLAPLEQAF